MAANKRLSALSGHLHPTSTHGEKCRRFLLDGLQKVSLSLNVEARIINK